MRRPRHFRGVILASITLVAACVSLGTAEALFSGPVDLSTGAGDARFPAVDVDADGNAVVAWTRKVGADEHLEARTLAADGTPGPVLALATAPDAQYMVGNARVATNERGDSIVAWVGTDSSGNALVQAVRVSPSGHAGPLRAISPATGTTYPADPVVGIDSDGRALVAWLKVIDPEFWSVVLQARSIPLTGPLTPVRTLTTAPEDLTRLDLAVNPSGQGWATWTRYDAGSRTIRARAIASDTTLGPAALVAPSYGFKKDSRVTVDDDGDALIGWEGFVGTGAGDSGIWARRITAAGAQGAPVEISPSSGSYQVRLDGDADGDAVLAWQRGNANLRIEGRSLSATNVLGPTRTVAEHGQGAFEPDVAVDPSGRGLIVWGRDDGTNVLAQARTMNQLGGLGTIQTLSAAGSDAFFPVVAIGLHRAAVAAWELGPGGAHSIQAANGP